MQFLHRSGPSSPVSTTGMGASPKRGAANGVTCTPNGSWDDRSRSAVVGTADSDDRRKVGVDAPSSTARNSTWLPGGPPSSADDHAPSFCVSL